MPQNILTLKKINYTIYKWEEEIKRQNAEKLIEALMVLEDQRLKNVCDQKPKLKLLKKLSLN